ncbi:hypothetical protein PC114_g19415, partial [Phytophthora cactorum]
WATCYAVHNEAGSR